MGSENITKVEGVSVVNGGLGNKILENRRLENRDEEILSDFDCILSVNNFGARSLSKIKSKVVRQIHTVARDRPLSSYVSLDPWPVEFLRMLAQKRREMYAEETLAGIGTTCVSNYNLEKMEYYQLERKENLFHIPNGIPTCMFRPSREDPRFDIIFIGRFQKLKGLDILLHSVAILWKRDVKPSVGIVGPFTFPQQKFCLNMVPNEVRRNIRFLGVIDHENIPRSINASKILVVPSRYESFSLPALEAIGCAAFQLSLLP